MDIDSLLDSLSSGDRVVYTFVLVWVICGTVWLALDWLGNPNRGVFRPKREQIEGTWRARRSVRRLKRAEGDAAVRSTLRDAYGASSLRALWNRKQEAEVLKADEHLVRGFPLPRKKRLWHSFLPELDENDPVLRRDNFLPTFDPEHPPGLPMPPQRGRWRPGLDPLMLSRSGATPVAATVRSRVWKNRAGEPVWGETNQSRMRSGKPPRRRNPVTGKTEVAAVDLATGLPFWRGHPVDPFSSACAAITPGGEL